MGHFSALIKQNIYDIKKEYKVYSLTCNKLGSCHSILTSKKAEQIKEPATQIYQRSEVPGQSAAAIIQEADTWIQRIMT